MIGITTKVEDQIVINTVEGDVRLREIAEYISENDHSWWGKSILWDMTNMDFRSMTTADVNIFLDLMKNHARNRQERNKAAIVTPNDEQFGMMRMVEQLASSRSFQVRVEVFRSMDEAVGWISEGKGDGTN